jgi:hypothetical protein
VRAALILLIVPSGSSHTCSFDGLNDCLRRVDDGRVNGPTVEVAQGVTLAPRQLDAVRLGESTVPATVSALAINPEDGGNNRAHAPHPAALASFAVAGGFKNLNPNNFLCLHDRIPLLFEQTAPHS